MRPEDAAKEPSAFIAALIAECEGSADLLTKDIPFPRNKPDGTPVRLLSMRQLSVDEECLAFANARAFTARVIKGEETVPWRPEEIEDNARASEILAVACRNNDDPSKPFFPHGPYDTRRFQSPELGQLMLRYGHQKEARWPAMKDMEPEELDKWIAIVSEGTLDYPFSLFSRTKLEAFADLCATELVELRARFETLTTSSTSAASEPTES